MLSISFIHPCMTTMLSFLQDLAVYNVALVLQSDKFSAQHMAQRVDAYIAQFMARLEALPQVNSTAS